MSSSSSSIDYAAYFGIKSAPAAGVFTVAYFILLGFFIVRSFQRPKFVFIILTAFCTIRVVAFAMRAILALSDSAAHSLNLIIAEQVLYSAGIFGVIFSAFRLVSDREPLLPRPLPFPLTRNNHLFRIFVMVAVVLQSIAASRAGSSDSGKVNSSKQFKMVAAIVFLVAALIVAFQTALLVRAERYVTFDAHRYQTYVLPAIAFFLIVRQGFALITVNQKSGQNEALFYPFSALAELLAVSLFMTPGLVPRSQSKEQVEMRSY